MNEQPTPSPKGKNRRWFLKVAAGTAGALFLGLRHCSSGGEKIEIYDVDDTNKDPHAVDQRGTVEYDLEEYANKELQIGGATISYTILGEKVEDYVGPDEWKQLRIQINTIKNGRGSSAVVATYAFLSLDTHIAKRFNDTLDAWRMPYIKSNEDRKHIKAWILYTFMKSVYAEGGWLKSNSQFFSHSTLDELGKFLDAYDNDRPIVISGKSVYLKLPYEGYRVIDPPVDSNAQVLGQRHNPQNDYGESEVERWAGVNIHPYYDPYLDPSNDDFTAQGLQSCMSMKSIAFCMVDFVHKSKSKEGIAIAIHGNKYVALREYFMTNDNGKSVINWLSKYVEEDKHGDASTLKNRLIDGFVRFCLKSNYAYLSPEIDILSDKARGMFFMLDTQKREHYLSYAGVGTLNTDYLQDTGIRLKEIGSKNKERRVYHYAKAMYEQMMDEYDIEDPERVGLAIVLHFLQQQYPTMEKFLQQDHAQLEENMKVIIEMLRSEGDNRSVDFGEVFNAYYTKLGLLPFFDKAFLGKNPFVKPKNESNYQSDVPLFRDEDETMAEAKKIEGTEEYIELFKGAALKLQQKYGVPAKLTLAQAILESGNGNSYLARQANNHFGMKWKNAKIHGKYKRKKAHDDCCTKATRGSCSGEQTDKFIFFDSVYEGYVYRAYTLFVKGRYNAVLTGENVHVDDDRIKKDHPSYAIALAKAKRFPTHSTQRQCYMIKALGYATSPNYGDKLISIIRRYNLERFDGM